MKTALALLTLALSLRTAAAQPLPEAPPPAELPGEPRAEAPNLTEHRHLGFYLRGDLGLGYLKAAEGTGGIIERTSGAAIGLGIAVGGAFSENNILAAHLFEVAHSAGHVANSSTGSTFDLGYGVGGFGMQYTHYFMPCNLYLSATLGVTQAVATQSHPTGSVSSFDHDWWDRHHWAEGGFGSDAAGRSRGGVGGELSVGKEWWVARHVGVGINATVAWSVNRDLTPTGHTTLSTGAALVAFSATYN